MYFFLFCIVTLVLMWFITHLHNIYNHLKEFPAPPIVPVLGHVFDYVDPKKALSILTNNLVNHGGVIRQYIGPRKPSLATANRDFLQFLCRHSKYIGKAKYYRYLKPWLGEGLLTSDGHQWLSRRKALTSSFTQSGVLRNFVGVFEEKSDQLIKEINDLSSDKANVHLIMKRFTLDVFCETAMRVSLSSLANSADSNYAISIESVCEVIQNRMTSFMKNFDFFFQFSSDCTREKKNLAVIDGMLHKIIKAKHQERRQIGNAKERKDMLDLMMEVDIEGKTLSSSELRAHVNSFTFAGYDTTSSAMSLVLYEIAENPSIQEKLLEEQMQIFSGKLNNASVTYEILHKMAYLDMVIKETLRLHTIVPCIGKRATKDLQYGNLPELIHAFHHNPNYFPEPDKFNPERFADETKIDPFAYIPFGVKPRQCLGKEFAMLEMKCALSKIIRNFQVVKVPDFQLDLRTKLVLFSANGIWVGFKKRIVTDENV
uniref:Cytochrome P450 n=1 Tax=Dendroctonus ponderosae TaxID=77166 RepID=A0AAR5QGA6_DENPD